MGIVRHMASVSLDGFTTGPNDSVSSPMGKGGLRLHEWIFGLDAWREAHGLEGGERNADAELIEQAMSTAGATVIGRRMFDHGEEPWGDEPPFRHPVFVVTHREREPLVKRGGTTFTFVTNGVESAVTRAPEAAGDQDVSVGGGADIAQQCLRADLLDEILISTVPVLMGGGVTMFDQAGIEECGLEKIELIDSTAVTHVRYRVKG